MTTSVPSMLGKNGRSQGKQQLVLPVRCTERTSQSRCASTDAPPRSMTREALGCVFDTDRCKLTISSISRRTKSDATFAISTNNQRPVTDQWFQTPSSAQQHVAEVVPRSGALGPRPRVTAAFSFDAAPGPSKSNGKSRVCSFILRSSCLVGTRVINEGVSGRTSCDSEPVFPAYDEPRPAELTARNLKDYRFETSVAVTHAPTARDPVPVHVAVTRRLRLTACCGALPCLRGVRDLRCGARSALRSPNMAQKKICVKKTANGSSHVPQAGRNGFATSHCTTHTKHLQETHTAMAPTVAPANCTKSRRRQQKQLHCGG